MEDKHRYKRLRLLVKGTNKERKKQARKIDILCNDLIAAQREFIKKLNTIGFAAGFYKAILGMTEMNHLLETSGRLLKDHIDAEVVFFLRQHDSFESYVFNGNQADAKTNRLETCFTPELVDGICKSNKICTLEDMFAMGLQGNLVSINKLTACTVPLDLAGNCLGFVLVYRSSDNKLTRQELDIISSVTSGLSRSVQSCQITHLTK